MTSLLSTASTAGAAAAGAFSTAGAATASAFSTAAEAMKNGASWLGRQIVALGPVLKQFATAVLSQFMKLAAVVSRVAGPAFSTISTYCKQGYGTVAGFVQGHPRDIVVFGAGAAAVGVISLIYHILFGSTPPAKVPASK